MHQLPLDRRGALAALDGHGAARVHRAAARPRPTSSRPHRSCRCQPSRDTEPPLPPVASPEPISSAPALPLLDVPELNTSMPLTPVAPAFALRISDRAAARRRALARRNAQQTARVHGAAASRHAALDRPQPLVPLPALTVTEPPVPPVAAPVPMEHRTSVARARRARAEHKHAAHASVARVRAADRDAAAARRRAIAAIEHERAARVHRAATRQTTSQPTARTARAAAHADRDSAARAARRRARADRSEPVLPVLDEPELNTSMPAQPRRARVRGTDGPAATRRRGALAALRLTDAARVHRAAAGQTPSSSRPHRSCRCPP